MLKATKKVYMSILAILLVFITVVATTFAWVGILTYAQTDNFNLNLKTQDLESDFYLSISATDEEQRNENGDVIFTTYSENANEYAIKKQIIKNMGYSVDGLDNDNLIDKKFYQIYRIYPTTTTMNELKNDIFHELDYSSADNIKTEKSNSFYKFDIYLSMEHRDGDKAIKEDTNQKMDLILADVSNTLKGDVASQIVANDFTYPSSNLYNPNGLTTITNSVNVDAASAARLAFAIYDPILRTEKYSGNEIPEKWLIYQGGTQYPTYYSESNTYSFGGILPEEYNLARYEHIKNRNIKKEFKIPEEAINRGDLELTDSNDLNKLFDDNYDFGVFNGKKTKVKITVYFWFEGWDADCFEIIDAVNVRININFATNSNTN